jgi:hypothetical protein
VIGNGAKCSQWNHTKPYLIENPAKEATDVFQAVLWRSSIWRKYLQVVGKSANEIWEDSFNALLEGFPNSLPRGFLKGTVSQSRNLL